MKYVTASRASFEGASVFGSAIVRVAPDTASVAVAVSRVEATPDAAFVGARDGAQRVSAFLRESGVVEFGSSRVMLTQEFRYANSEQHFAGYKAKIDFNVVVRDLDKLDALLTGLIAAGANELKSVAFETARLRELRDDARRRAIASAREKAALYCEAAGVALGRVSSIEDLNPDVLAARSGSHVTQEPHPVEDRGDTARIDPGAITIGAAVNVVFEIA